MLTTTVVSAALLIAVNSFNVHFSRPIRSGRVDPVHSSKENLLNFLDSTAADKIFLCPEYMVALNRTRRFYGFIEESYYEAIGYDNKYKIIPDKYIDFTIQGEVDKPMLSQSFRENIGQTFFQNPLISGIYERGYRQNFQNAGFPGIEKEFEEVSEYFQDINARTILDLSCGSGFMTRRFLKSELYVHFPTLREFGSR